MSSTYSDIVHVRIAPLVNVMISDAAAQRGQKPAEWLRNAIRTALQIDGFDPATIPPRDAGTLYDVIDGKQRYALVSPGQPNPIVHVSTYRDAKPDMADVNHHPRGYMPAEGDAWVPVVHEDSEPFDAARHWRLPPHYVLENEYATPVRVVCVYPVVPKSMEWA